MYQIHLTPSAGQYMEIGAVLTPRSQDSATAYVDAILPDSGRGQIAVVKHTDGTMKKLNQAEMEAAFFPPKLKLEMGDWRCPSQA